MAADEDIREGEIRVEPPEGFDASLHFIGRIHTPWTDRADCPRQGDPSGPECSLEIFEPWVPALEGIERHETLEVLYWLDRARRDLVRQSPRNHGYSRGTFALRSPVRPKPIGTARVRLVRVEGPRLIVRSLDCLDGTPLIDLKPARCAHGGPA